MSIVLLILASLSPAPPPLSPDLMLRAIPKRQRVLVTDDTVIWLDGRRVSWEQFCKQESTITNIKVVQRDELTIVVLKIIAVTKRKKPCGR